MASNNVSGCNTHEVFNQPPELKGYNGYQLDLSLQRALHQGGAEWAETMVDNYALAVSSDLHDAWFRR